MMLALIPVFPLIGFLINGLWYAAGQAPAGRGKVSSRVTGTIASLAIGASFVVSLILFLRLAGLPEDARSIEVSLFSWMQVAELNIPIAFRFDSLSSLFALVITGVGTLIHIYSIGYMSHDESPGKFFAYLNLFCFAMLVLVLGSSLPLMFLGWEGVGLCSYLLIGFWYTDPEKASAGKKAFIVNRVGDFGFLLGMFLIFTTFGTFDFQVLRQTVEGGVQAGILTEGTTVITAICLLLFLGCTGKSAQIPLYVWLPDAMAGPTPVSALIHAATMVTSGVYLLSRVNFLYSLSPVALATVATIGGLTAFFAATIAFVQKDIKKILAYSTISQLGYMFLACGVAAYSAGVFHVITHAFFKALLFLGAGSVIHGMHEEQNIMNMGGLRRYMPRTFATFAVAWIAICGLPPFSGFFSKDEILWRTFAGTHGSKGLWLLGTLTAIMTAFYMTRLFYLTFLGKPRFVEHGGENQTSVAHAVRAPHSDALHEHQHHGVESKGVHESPAIMTTPLVVLAVLSAVGGFIGIPHLSWLDHWLSPVIPSEHGVAPGITASMEWIMIAVSTLGAVFGIFIAIRLYRNLDVPARLAKKWSALHRAAENKWYIDEFLELTIVRPIYLLSVALWRGFDVAVIDRVVLGFGRASQWTGQAVRVVQTGSLQLYAFMLLAGIVLTVGYIVYGLA